MIMFSVIIWFSVNISNHIICKIIFRNMTFFAYLSRHNYVQTVHIYNISVFIIPEPLLICPKEFSRTHLTSGLLDTQYFLNQKSITRNSVPTHIYLHNTKSLVILTLKTLALSSVLEACVSIFYTVTTN